MSAWFVLCACGLHHACPSDPRYEGFTLLFEQVTLRIDPQYGPNRRFVIKTVGDPARSHYVQSATLNGKALGRCRIGHGEIVAGGALELRLWAKPNKGWGLPRPGLARSSAGATRGAAGSSGGKVGASRGCYPGVTFWVPARTPGPSAPTRRP